MGDCFRSLRRAVVAAGLLAGLAFGTPAPADAAPVSGCLDWEAYASGSAPAGSGDLGPVDGSSARAGGESVTLTQILGQELDLRITWAQAHTGQILDGGNTSDFDDVDLYSSAAGGPSTKTVFRYFPLADQQGQVTFEFFEAGTTNPAPVQIDHLLTGGQRKFGFSTWGTSLFSLSNGGSPVVPAFADPDLELVDNDGPATISGLGSTPIVQLDAPQFGSLSSSAWLESANAYSTVGALNVRPWTVLDWGAPLADTLVWDVFGSGGLTDPQPDPETVDAASPTFPHTGLSAYISGFCITIPEPVYDLALAKVQSAAYDPATRQAAFEVTVHNQGEAPSGAFTVTDLLPAGTSVVSTGGGVAGTGIVTWTVDAADELAPGESQTFTLVLQVDDPSQSPFENRAEISSTSGTDCDSQADTNVSTGDALVDVTDPADLVGGGCDPAGADEDDHDVASFVVDPVTDPTTTTTTSSEPSPAPPSDSDGQDAGQGALPVTGASSYWFVLVGLVLAAVGMIVTDSGAHLAWRRRLDTLSGDNEVA